MRDRRSPRRAGSDWYLSDFDQAIRDYKTALSLVAASENQRRSPHLGGRGQVFLAQEKAAEALADLEQSLGTFYHEARGESLAAKP